MAANDPSPWPRRCGSGKAAADASGRTLIELLVSTALLVGVLVVAVQGEAGLLQAGFAARSALDAAAQTQAALAAITLDLTTLPSADATVAVPVTVAADCHRLAIHLPDGGQVEWVWDGAGDGEAHRRWWRRETGSWSPPRSFGSFRNLCFTLPPGTGRVDMELEVVRAEGSPIRRRTTVALPVPLPSP